MYSIDRIIGMRTPERYDNTFSPGEFKYPVKIMYSIMSEVKQGEKEPNQENKKAPNLLTSLEFSGHHSNRKSASMKIIVNHQQYMHI